MTMRRGDLVNVLRIADFQGTVWVLAEVVEVKQPGFAVRALNGGTLDGQHTHQWLSYTGRGLTWEKAR